MKKLIVFTLIVIVVMSMIITCPTREAHSEAIKTLISEVVDNMVKEKTSKAKTGNEILDGIMSIGGSIAGSALESGINSIVENVITVDNYFILSLGRVEYREQKQIVSVGFFGHVFTLPEDMVKKQVEKKLNDQMEETSNLL